MNVWNVFKCRCMKLSKINAFSLQKSGNFPGGVCPEMHIIRCTQISISVTKCPLALLPNFNITHVTEYGQKMSQSVPQMLLFK